ncbi:hypothetical protein [Pseudomonas sp. DG56-2]|nr:hypothetical protein [Pseudomonas sp. DG56-2]
MMLIDRMVRLELRMIRLRRKRLEKTGSANPEATHRTLLLVLAAQR